MVRFTLINILILLAPLVLFLLWRLFVRKPGRGRLPVEALLLAGMVAAVLASGAFVVLQSEREDYPDDVQWIPPQVVDGEVVPGRFVTVDPDAPGGLEGDPDAADAETNAASGAGADDAAAEAEPNNDDAPR